MSRLSLYADKDPCTNNSRTCKANSQSSPKYPVTNSLTIFSSERLLSAASSHKVLQIRHNGVTEG